MLPTRMIMPIRVGLVGLVYLWALGVEQGRGVSGRGIARGYPSMTSLVLRGMNPTIIIRIVNLGEAGPQVGPSKKKNRVLLKG